MNKMHAINIDKLNLSKYIYNALRRAGISTLGELDKLIDEGAIKNISNIGEQGEEEIIDNLMKFKENLDEKEDILSTQFDKSYSTKENPSPLEIGNNLPVDILNDYLDRDIVKQLYIAKIFTLGDLNDVVSAYLKVMESDESILAHANEELSKAVKSLILDKGLHINAMLDGKSISNILYQTTESLEERLTKYSLLKEILNHRSLYEELNDVFNDLSSHEKEIFISYTIERIPFSDLCNRYNLSRERIRQIISQSENKLCSKLENKPNLFLQSVFILADGLGESLSPEELENQLEEVRLIESKNKHQNKLMLKMCMAMMINSQTSILIDPVFRP